MSLWNGFQSIIRKFVIPHVELTSTSEVTNAVREEIGVLQNNFLSTVQDTDQALFGLLVFLNALEELQNKTPLKLLRSEDWKEYYSIRFQMVFRPKKVKEHAPVTLFLYETFGYYFVVEIDLIEKKGEVINIFRVIDKQVENSLLPEKEIQTETLNENARGLSNNVH